MAKVVRVLCDRCMGEADGQWVVRGPSGTARWDLCTKCGNELDKFAQATQTPRKRGKRDVVEIDPATGEPLTPTQ